MTFEFVASFRLDVGGLGTGAVNFLRLFDTELDDERMEVVHGKTMLVWGLGKFELEVCCRPAVGSLVKLVLGAAEVILGLWTFGELELGTEIPGEPEILGRDLSDPELDPDGLGREEPDRECGASLGKILTGEVGGLRPKLKSKFKINSLIRKIKFVK